jgi:hypothetical protein
MYAAAPLKGLEGDDRKEALPVVNILKERIKSTSGIATPDTTQIIFIFNFSTCQLKWL